mgnify:CR=1 FL=1
MERYLAEYVRKDHSQKMILLSGPRQSGKTTLVRQLFDTYDYFNFDSEDDRKALKHKRWRRDVDAVLFDELHKMPQWKQWLKGIYDTEQTHPRIVVTGSANLEMFRRVGDSLAGRYFSYRLHPLDLEEITRFQSQDSTVAFKTLMACSGFPEPYLQGDKIFYKRWRKTHLDIILRQDWLDLFSVRSLKKIELLVDCLVARAACSISYTNIAQDLHVDVKTVQNWIMILENFYAVFRVIPYHHNIARSLLKEPKVYFYDAVRVCDPGARLENLVACALLKRLHFLEDTQGCLTKLHYLRTKEGKEVDFLVVIDDRPVAAIEVKTSDDPISKSLIYFQKKLKGVEHWQLVFNIGREYDTPQGIKVRSLIPFLRDIHQHLKP